MEYRDAIELPFSSRQLFTLLADIERYPEFLPHWHVARIIRRQGNQLIVQQQLGAGPLALQFQSTATLEAYHRLRIVGQGRRLKALQIEWQIAQCSSGRCRVELQAQLALGPGIGLLQRPMQALFRDSNHQLMRFFERRAHSLFD